MKSGFSNEWKRLLTGGATIGAIYTLIAVPTGLSAEVSRILPGTAAAILGVFTGCLFLIINAFLLEWTVRKLPERGKPKQAYFLSYLGRYLLAGLTLAAGFLFFDPFAVFAVLLSPKLTYLFSAVTEKDLD